ncbi:MAG: hypothetical protein NC307_04515 [Roseburia sp.]|nr:hypothetical protein [Roseburia sp.]
MLTKPFNGRCLFSLGNFNIQMSCVTDIPFDWLGTCKFGLENYTDVSLILADHGNEYIVLLLMDKESRLLKDIEGKRSVDAYEIGLADFTERLLMDIQDDFEEWVNWYPAKILGGPDAGRKESLETLLADTTETLENFKNSLQFGRAEKKEDRSVSQCLCGNVGKG